MFMRFTLISLGDFSDLPSDSLKTRGEATGILQRMKSLFGPQAFRSAKPIHFFCSRDGFCLFYLRIEVLKWFNVLYLSFASLHFQIQCPQPLNSRVVLTSISYHVMILFYQYHNYNLILIYLQQSWGPFSSASKLHSALLQRLGFVNNSDAIGCYSKNQLKVGTWSTGLGYKVI